VQSQTERYRAKAKEFTRPEGNITGNTILGLEVSGKHLELIKEVIPSVSRVAFLWNPNNTSHPGQLAECADEVIDQQRICCIRSRPFMALLGQCHDVRLESAFGGKTGHQADTAK
jgi:hypothetical protein